MLFAFMDKKVYTNCFICKEDKILLGMKKRGFGVGRWNGFGGKVQGDESVEKAARRELFEEAGLLSEFMEKRAILLFDIQRGLKILEVHVFITSFFRGEPQESEEMRLQWFAYEDIPYAGMWQADHYWLPLILKDVCVQGSFFYEGDDEKLVRYELQEVTENAFGLFEVLV